MPKTAQSRGMLRIMARSSFFPARSHHWAVNAGGAISLVVKPNACHAVAGWRRTVFGVSERRAVSAGGFNRSSHRCRSRPDPQTPLRERQKDLVAERMRDGYRRLNVLLRRERREINHMAQSRAGRPPGTHAASSIMEETMMQHAGLDASVRENAICVVGAHALRDRRAGRIGRRASRGGARKATSFDRVHARFARPGTTVVQGHFADADDRDALTSPYLRGRALTG